MPEIRFFVKYSDIHKSGKIAKLDKDCSPDQSGILFKHSMEHLVCVKFYCGSFWLDDPYEMYLIGEIKKADQNESLACVLIMQ